MKDLNRFVTRKYAANWHNIAIELGLELDVLDIIKKDYQQYVDCFMRALDKWLKLTSNATWRILEFALTNVRRQQLGLDPVDSEGLINFYN